VAFYALTAALTRMTVNQLYVHPGFSNLGNILDLTGQTLS